MILFMDEFKLVGLEIIEFGIRLNTSRIGLLSQFRLLKIAAQVTKPRTIQARSLFVVIKLKFTF